MLSAGGVWLDSVLQWWYRLLRVFPVCDSEPGSVFGPITGDPDPGLRPGSAWFPFATVIFSLPTPPPRRSLSLSSVAELSHAGTDDQTPTSPLLSARRPASSGSGRPPSLPP